MHFLALIFSIENTRFYSLIISNIFIPITFVTGIILAIKKVREGYRPAKYYLIAFFIFMFGAIIWSAMTAGLLPTNIINNPKSNYQAVALEANRLKNLYFDHINLLL